MMEGVTDTHSQTFCGESINWRSPLDLSTRSLENPGEEGEERLWESTEMEETQRTRPTESTKQVLYGLTESEVTYKRPTSVCIKSSAYMLWLFVWCFCWTPKSRSCCVSDSFACSKDSFSPTGLPCSALVWGDLSYLIVSCVIVLNCCLLEACSFLKVNEEGGSQGEVEWRRGVWEE